MATKDGGLGDPIPSPRSRWGQAPTGRKGCEGGAADRAAGGGEGDLDGEADDGDGDDDEVEDAPAVLRGCGSWWKNRSLAVRDLSSNGQAVWNDAPAVAVTAGQTGVRKLTLVKQGLPSSYIRIPEI